jgi:hypothetical protein
MEQCEPLKTSKKQLRKIRNFYWRKHKIDAMTNNVLAAYLNNLASIYFNWNPLNNNWRTLLLKKSECSGIRNLSLLFLFTYTITLTGHSVTWQLHFRLKTSQMPLMIHCICWNIQKIRNCNHGQGRGAGSTCPQTIVGLPWSGPWGREHMSPDDRRPTMVRAVG